MKTKFTKEYIELCKNKKIQELRPKFKYGDWFVKEDGDYDLSLCLLPSLANNNRENLIMILTDTQLEEEIIKICDDNHWDYRFEVLHGYHNLKRVWVEETHIGLGGYKEEDRYPFGIFEDTNPLIAKIKLLIQLLQQEAK